MTPATRRRYGRIAGVLAIAAVAGAGLAHADADARPASSAARAQLPVYDGGMWKVEINSLATRVEDGNISGFDRGQYSSTVYGGTVAVVGRAREDSYFLRDAPPGRPAGRDGATVYSITTTSSTEVRVTCKPGPAVFTGEGTGKGQLKIGFHDGAALPPDRYGVGASLLFVTAGTGYSKAAIGLKAEGDLAYDPTGQPSGIAESVGDEPSGLQGSASIPGLEGGPGLAYTPHVGAGEVSKTIARAKTVTGRTKQTFEFSVESHISSDVKVDDSLVGAGTAEVAARVAHTALITGSRCVDPTRGESGHTSMIRVNILTKGLKTSALITVLTNDIATGQGIDVIQGWHGPSAAVFHKTDRRLLVDTGWGRSQHWNVDREINSYRPARRVATPRAPHPGRLGVERGSASGYVVAAKGAMSALKSLSFAVARADRETGRVVLRGTAAFRNGRVDSSVMPVGVFTGDGGIRMILVPAGMTVGDRLYGIGKVVSARGDRMTVSYAKGRARASGVYDRTTGWLVELTVGNPRRPDFTLTRR